MGLEAMVEAPSEGGGIDAVTQLFGGGAAEIGADVSSQESLITPLFTKVRRERENRELVHVRALPSTAATQRTSGFGRGRRR